MTIFHLYVRLSTRSSRSSHCASRGVRNGCKHRINAERESVHLAPSKQFSEDASLNSIADYDRLYRESIEQPEVFWSRQAEENLHWVQNMGLSCFLRFLDNREKGSPVCKWFEGGRTNVSFNCLDRQPLNVASQQGGDNLAGRAGGERRVLTYQQLHTEVCRFANVLKKRGVKRGSAVTLFMPMVPELAIAMLACARIGAIHSVVFSAFSAEALKNRIQDCAGELVVTADVGFHGGKVIDLKAKVDQALLECPTVSTVIVFKRGNGQTNMETERDYWWHDEINAQIISVRCEAEQLESETPLFILYTSGSTGKPKGVLHTTAGYLLYAHLTFRHVFDIKDTDIYWCTADIGWITGHFLCRLWPSFKRRDNFDVRRDTNLSQADRLWKIVEGLPRQYLLHGTNRDSRADAARRRLAE